MRIEESIYVDAPTDRVWALIKDPAALTGLEEGLAIEADAETPGGGLRAHYRILVRVGPTPIGADVEIVEFTPGRELAWTSLTGVDHRFRLRLREAGAKRTRLVLRFGYSSAGPLGLLADLVSYGRLRATFRRLLAAVKLEAERPPRRPRRAPARSSNGTRQ
ncbi:MAG: SRPBCC family protein [Actinobacteria bacterium]|nr:MAG: SRPBCC family protein [Actinomycetota bacterium]